MLGSVSRAAGEGLCVPAPPPLRHAFPSSAATAPAALARSAASPAPRILLVATLHWPTAARLAIAFAQLGCRVEAVCPPEHACARTRAVRGIHRYETFRSLPALRRAVDAAGPDLIIPCDDKAAAELHRLHAGAGGPAAEMKARIGRSLGSPAACALAMARNALAALARAEGIRVPPTTQPRDGDALDAWLGEHGLPAVIKIDGSWGGRGVTVVRRRDEAHRVLRVAAARPSMRRVLSCALLERDNAPLLSWLEAPRAVTVQAFVSGTPANRAVACWQGEVLAGISVAALRTQHPTGPATVVRIIDNAEMAEAARRLVRRLGVSGLWGIDFVLGAKDGAAYLIEANPRATPICHLALGPGRDLPAALCRQLAGGARRERATDIAGEVLALFPGEWRRDANSPYLASGYHDVPWTETDLIRDGVELPWGERGWLARGWSWVRRGRRRPGAPPAPPLRCASKTDRAAG
jgi:biotin carboxylase